VDLFDSVNQRARVIETELTKAGKLPWAIKLPDKPGCCVSEVDGGLFKQAAES
jgi:hypothetical protein